MQSLIDLLLLLVMRTELGGHVVTLVNVSSATSSLNMLLNVNNAIVNEQAPRLSVSTRSCAFWTVISIVAYSGWKHFPVFYDRIVVANRFSKGVFQDNFSYFSISNQ